jgi:hypothetical protein
MRIAVLEHFTSIPVAVGCFDRVAEGRAMRDAVVADLLRLPAVEVVVVERRAVFGAALRTVDAALVIAPETGGVLARLCRAVERRGLLLLGPSSPVVRLLADKLRTSKCLTAAGVATPRTEALPLDMALGRLRRRVPPFVLKPRDGCGGEGVIVVRRASEAKEALDAVRRATRRDDCLVQEYVEGDAASVSLIVSGDPLDLGLNRQRLRRGRALAYLGGETFWPHPRAGEAVAGARAAIEALARAGAGARGYVGVDLILGRNGATIIEVNPRLTTSYVGLRRSVRENLAALILDAAAGRALPRCVTPTGRCRFRADGRFTRLDGPPPPGAAPRAGAGPETRNGGWPVTSAGTSAASISNWRS